MCLCIILVFCQTNRITRPVSNTAAVKTTSYEFLLLYSTSLRSRFSLFRGHCRSRMTVVNRKLRERRQTRNADNRDSSCSPAALRLSRMVASPSYMDSESWSSTSCTSHVSSCSSTTEAKSSISRSKAAVKSVSSSPDSSSSEFGSSSVSRASVSWPV